MGVEINKAELQTHPFEHELLQCVFYDGAVGDWRIVRRRLDEALVSRYPLSVNLYNTGVLPGNTMQQIALNAEVNLHEQDVVSIFHETNVADTDEKFAELVFSGAFAIRSMSNLGANEVTDALGHQLELIGRLIADTPNDVLNPKPKIVPYPGHGGRKRFISNLRLTASQMQLDYSPKGFGLFATGVGYYCPAAVQSIFRYLASRRLDEGAYLNALAEVAAGSGQLQLNREIQVSNHPQLVRALILNCLVDFMPDWLQ